MFSYPPYNAHFNLKNSYFKKYSLRKLFKRPFQLFPMEEGINLKGNIALVGFEILEPTEMTVIKKIVGTYVKKLNETGDYKEMRLTLQQHARGKSFKHEIQGLAFINNKRFSSEATEWNLYNAVSQVCEKIYNEAKHYIEKEQRYIKKERK